MPIKPEMRGFYPRDWPEISKKVRFGCAAGACQSCGRPHGVRYLPDGRWFDAVRDAANEAAAGHGCENSQGRETDI